jgi:hypothetical protein
MAYERKTPEQRVAELEQKKRQLENRIRSENAKLKDKARRTDTRRKILTGAVALEHAAHDPAFRDALDKLIAKAVTREDDRALFGLPPLVKGEPENA